MTVQELHEPLHFIQTTNSRDWSEEPPPTHTHTHTHPNPAEASNQIQMENDDRAKEAARVPNLLLLTTFNSLLDRSSQYVTHI